jgi:hypothetical protein
MDRLPDDLRRLREADSDLALILDVFAEIDRAYREALEAMGQVGSRAAQVMNCAEVTVSFRHPSWTSGD